jgi:hypothetical protein
MTTSQYFTMPKMPKKVDDFNWVSAPNFQNAQVRASIDFNDYFVSLQSLEKTEGVKGAAIQRTAVIRFRGRTKEELREKILAELPQATFSMKEENNNRFLTDALRVAHAEEMERQRSIQAEADAEAQFRAEILAEHRNLARQMSAEDQAMYTNASLGGLATDPESPHRQFLHDNPGFLSFPDGQMKNRETLLKYCQLKNYWPIPTLPELSEAFQYCIENKHFYMRQNYRPSQCDERNSVRELTTIRTVRDEFTQNDIERVIASLKQKFGSPIRCDVSRIESLGISHEKAAALCEIIRAHVVGKTINANATDTANPRRDVGKMSAAELKADLQRDRAARGVRSHRENQRTF